MSTAQPLSLFESSLSVVPAVKIIRWPVNYNNKMGNSGFVHIDLAPGVMPVRSKIEEVSFRIYTNDGTHPPVDVLLFDMLLLPLYKIPCVITIASHGLDEVEFAKYMIHKHNDKVDLHTMLCIYYYKQVR